MTPTQIATELANYGVIHFWSREYPNTMDLFYEIISLPDHRGKKMSQIFYDWELAGLLLDYLNTRYNVEITSRLNSHGRVSVYNIKLIKPHGEPIVLREIQSTHTVQAAIMEAWIAQRSLHHLAMAETPKDYERSE